MGAVLNSDFLPPSAAWTAESGFFSAAQLRRSLIADRVGADAGPVDFHEVASVRLNSNPWRLAPWITSRSNSAA